MAGVSAERISPVEEIGERRVDALAPPRHDLRAHCADHPRLRVLYEHYWTDLCRYIRANFGSGPPEPADVAQTAFARYLSIEDRSVVENPRAFLYTTARNIALDFTRHRKHADLHRRSATQDGSAATIDEFSPERITLARERAAALAAAVENLPHRQRQALLLNRLHELSYSEIAARIGSSKSDVRRQIARALEALEAAMDELE